MTPESVAVPPEWVEALERFVAIGGVPDVNHIQMQANLWRQQCPALAARLDAFVGLIRASGAPHRDAPSEDPPGEPSREYRLMGYPRGGFTD